jgi:hypothetical protein
LELRRFLLRLNAPGAARQSDADHQQGRNAAPRRQPRQDQPNMDDHTAALGTVSNISHDVSPFKDGDRKSST